MPDPTRLYLRDSENSYRPLAWFQNNRPNEMLLGIYSLQGSGQPLLRSMWPEIEINDAGSPVTYKYSDRVDVGCKVDHVTCHADGKFHIKTKDNKDLYIHEMQRVAPLGADTPTFLDIIILSDLPENYASVSEKVKFSHLWVSASSGNWTDVRGMFSGANYNLERVMAELFAKRGAALAPALQLQSGTIKGYLAPRARPVGAAAAAERPRGTIVSFLFPIAGKEYWRAKTFLFE